MEKDEVIQFGLDHEISPQLPVVKELRAIKNAVIALAEKEQPEPEKRPEVQKVSIEGAEAFIIKGEKGDKGDQGEKGEQGEKGLDGRDGKDGVNGKDGLDGLNGLDGKDGADGQNGKDGSPDTAEQVRDKLASLEDDERLDASAIKGLREQFEALSSQISSIPRGGGSPRGDVLKVDDLTSYTDGSTKTFYLEKAPKNLNVVKVWGSDFPFIMTHGKGFTITGKLLTLADDVDSPLQGAKLVCEYTI